MASASVFICYAHADKRWLDRLLVHLAPFVRHNRIAVWSDKKIEAGQKWNEEIAAQLHTARAAVLLVSPQFLASEYIANNELPVLLKRAEHDGVTILPVLLYPSAYKPSVQAVGTPSKTLSEMKRAQQDRLLVQLSERIDAILQAQPEPPSAQSLPEEESRVSISHLPSAGAWLVGREAELARLQQAWENSREHVLTVIGRGGEGKSNLVRHWLNALAANDWPDTGRVYGWSFYSQGTNDKAASADQFIDSALRFFGEKEPERLKSADARGERLAELVGRDRNLLILDGLEPLQYPPGPMHGRLKDPALHTLITGLVAKNRGLCVITTREKLPELASTAHSLSPEIELPALTPPPAAQLLANLGVTGSNAERETVAEKLGGHAFSIYLLGTYLAEVHGGDISHAGEVVLLDEHSESTRHARHILASYEKWLSGGALADSDQEAAEAKQAGAEMLAVLRLLGLFDRPATMDAINALRAEPAIPGLTEPLVALTSAEWQRTLARLRNLHLIEHHLGEVETVDAHPLLREYFAEQLEKIPDSATEAHRRLYEHFRSAAPDLPGTVREMAPLFQAVVHGCKAGEWQDALDEIYYRRIQRQNTNFASRQLGATGACLAALAAFFTHPWRRLTGAFSPGDTIYILANTGLYLDGVGRFSECVEPSLLAVDFAVSTHDWQNACTGAANLSDTYRTLGNVAAALTYAEQSIEFALRSENENSGARAGLAEKLHAAAAREEARRSFSAIEAEGSLLLVGLPGFLYMDLLMRMATSRPMIQEIASRNERLLMASEDLSLYDRAVPRLLIGRTCALLDSNIERGQRMFNEAISLLRQAARADLLAMGLVWRAEFGRMTGRREDADRDLTEAEQLSSRHGMLRWEIESAVERAWFRHTFGGDAREKVTEAKQLINRTEKPCVPHVWTFEEQEPPPGIGVFKEGQLIGYYRCNDSIAELEGLLG